MIHYLIVYSPEKQKMWKKAKNRNSKRFKIRPSHVLTSHLLMFLLKVCFYGWIVNISFIISAFLLFLLNEFKRRCIFLDPSNTIPSTGARPKEKCKSLKYGSRGAWSKQNIRSHSFNEDRLSRKTFFTGSFIGQFY